MSNQAEPILLYEGNKSVLIDESILPACVENLSFEFRHGGQDVRHTKTEHHVKMFQGKSETIVKSSTLRMRKWRAIQKNREKERVRDNARKRAARSKGTRTPSTGKSASLGARVSRDNDTTFLSRGPFLVATESERGRFDKMFKQSEGTYRMTHFFTYKISSTFVHEFNFPGKETWSVKGSLIQSVPALVRESRGNKRMLILPRPS